MARETLARHRRATLAATWTLAVGVLTGWPANAQRALTLDEALAIARATSRDLRAARARLKGAAARVEQVRAALLPQVDAQGTYTHNYKEVTLDLAQEMLAPTLGLAEVVRANGTPGEQAAVARYQRQLAAASGEPVVLQKGEQLSAALNVTVPLIAPSAWTALAAAKETYRADVANYSVVEAGLLLAVAQTYYAAAGADELSRARRDAVAVARETLGRARVRLDAGSATTVETLRAEVALVKVQQAAREAEDVRARAYRTLATLLGTTEMVRVAPGKVAAPEPPPESALLGDALRLRPDLTLFDRSIAAAASNARSFGWRWAPVLSAFGTAQAFNYLGFSGDYYCWSVGLQLSWTLYDGGLRDAKRRESVAQQEELRARRALLRDTVGDEVADARRVLLTQRHALDSAVRSAELSRETLRVVRVLYESGRATQLDLLQAQDALQASEVAVAQARFALALADLELRRSTGTFPGVR